MLHRSNNSPLLLILSIAAILVGLSIFVPMLRKNRFASNVESPAIGKSVEMIRLEPLGSAATPIDAEKMRGRVVFLNFWGTWCPPCRLELPHLTKMYRELREDPDLLFVTVSCDDGKDLPELQRDTEEFLERYEFSDLPTYADPTGETRSHIAALAGFGESFFYPTTVAIDQRGVIRGIWKGVDQAGPEVTVNEQRALLESLLK